jgi:hypothetical protein
MRFVVTLCVIFGLAALFLHASFASPDAGAQDAGVGSSPSTVVIVNIPDPADHPTDFAGKMFQAYQSRSYRVLIMGGLMLLVWALRTVSKRLQNDRAGAATALVVSIAGAFLTALADDAPLNAWLIFDGLLMAASASGTYVLIKRLARPKDAAAVA